MLPTEQPATPIPAPDESGRYNFLLLGGDYRKHREGTGWGNKTDVMLLVSIDVLGEPSISVFQFNRNFYHPVEAMDDMWLFAVYGKEGFPGLHYYFQEVFKIDLAGIAYINMDNFAALVDQLGGLEVAGRRRDGEEILAYLRDNDNNWGCGTYDCGDRQFLTLLRLADEIKLQFLSKDIDPLDAAELIWYGFGGMVETDLSEIGQFYYLTSIAWQLALNPPVIRGPFKMDEWQEFIYGDVPLEVRGWKQREGYDVGNWIPGIWRAFP